MDGWIKLHRKTLKHWIWGNSKYLQGWVYCLFRANYEENKALIGATLIELKPGEFITSIGNFAKDTEMTSQEVRTFWNLLEADEMITRKSTSTSTKLTICNYDSYQDQQQTNNKPATNQQQTNNKPATTEKKEKKVKKVKNSKESTKENNSETIPPLPVSIPEKKEFVDYATSKNPRIMISQVKVKYEAWKENGWRDGFDKPIKNWKSKLLNSMNHMKEIPLSEATPRKLKYLN